jgi:hypothetical protein
LVTGWPPNYGGPGMPQGAMTSSRSPSTLLRTIGASWSWKMPGNAGRLPVLSWAARIAAWPLVSDYGYRMADRIGDGRVKLLTRSGRERADYLARRGLNLL